MANIHSNISFRLVNIPIVMMPIIKDNDASFNQLHNKFLSRIKYIKYCQKCKKDIKENEIIKGYQYEIANIVGVIMLIYIYIGNYQSNIRMLEKLH